MENPAFVGARGEAGPGLELLEDAGQSERDLVVMAAGDDLQTDGSPSDVWPHGIEIAGFQHRLASIVNGVDIAPLPVSTPAMTDGGGPSAGNAGTAVVGHSTTSTSRNRRAQSSSSCSRALIDRAYFGSVVFSVCSSDRRVHNVKSSARDGHMSGSISSHNVIAPVVSQARTGIGELHRLVVDDETGGVGETVRRRLDDLGDLGVDGGEPEVERPSRAQASNVGRLDRVLVGDARRRQREPVAVVRAGEHVEDAGRVRHRRRERTANAGVVAGRAGHAGCGRGCTCGRASR